jgi:hypothetical protein
VGVKYVDTVNEDNQTNTARTDLFIKEIEKIVIQKKKAVMRGKKKRAFTMINVQYQFRD